MLGKCWGNVGKIWENVGKCWQNVGEMLGKCLNKVGDLYCFDPSPFIPEKKPTRRTAVRESYPNGGQS